MCYVEFCKVIVNRAHWKSISLVRIETSQKTIGDLISIRIRAFSSSRHSDRVRSRSLVCCSRIHRIRRSRRSRDRDRSHHSRHSRSLGSHSCSLGRGVCGRAGRERVCGGRRDGLEQICRLELGLCGVASQRQ